MKRSLLAIALACATASTQAGNFYIPFGAMHYDFNDEANISNRTLPTLGAGYRFDDHWAAEAMFAKGQADDSIGKWINTNADVTHYRLDGLFLFDDYRSVTPYLVGGVSENKIDWQHGSTTDSTAVNVGVGLLYQLSTHWALRGDIRGIYNLDEALPEAAANLLAQYQFGGDEPVAAAAPAPVPVAAVPAPVAAPADSDHDGVPDSRDECPNTPAGHSVNARGCEAVVEESIQLAVLFDTNSAVVKPAYRAEVEQVAKFLSRHDKTTVTIEGHTDNRGKPAHNQKLSTARANAIRDMLVRDFGVAASRVNAVGYGEDKPVADNGTPEGQQKNRRVIAVFH